MLERLALAHPHIAFSLKRDDEAVFHYPAQSLHERVAAVVGEDFQAASLEIDSGEGLMRLSGVIAKPTFAKGKSSQQYCFVNRRFRARQSNDACGETSLPRCAAPSAHTRFCAVSRFAAPKMSTPMCTPPKPKSAFATARPCTNWCLTALNKALAHTRADQTESVGNAGQVLHEMLGVQRPSESLSDGLNMHTPQPNNFGGLSSGKSGARRLFPPPHARNSAAFPCAKAKPRSTPTPNFTGANRETRIRMLN